VKIRHEPKWTEHGLPSVHEGPRSERGEERHPQSEHEALAGSRRSVRDVLPFRNFHTVARQLQLHLRELGPE
jgi:hypothetical protein